MTKQYMWWIRGLITVGPWARPDSIKMPPLSLASPDIDWKCCCSVAKSSLTWRRHGLQHACLPCLSLSPGVCSNSCPLSQWCHPTISFSVIPFSYFLQSFPASGPFPVSWVFASGGQSINTSALASVFTVNIQCWFPLGLTGLIFLQSNGLSKIFSRTTIWKHQFFSTQPSLCFNCHIHTWLLEKP